MMKHENACHKGVNQLFKLTKCPRFLLVLHVSKMYEDHGTPIDWAAYIPNKKYFTLNLVIFPKTV